MFASHLLAGDHIKDRDDEKAGAASDHQGIEHRRSPGFQRASLSCAARAGVGAKIACDAYKCECERDLTKYKTHIYAGSAHGSAVTRGRRRRRDLLSATRR